MWDLEQRIRYRGGGKSKSTGRVKSQQDALYYGAYVWEIKGKLKRRNRSTQHLYPTCRKSAAQQWASWAGVFVRAGQPEPGGFYSKYCQQSTSTVPSAQVQSALPSYREKGRRKETNAIGRSGTAERDGSTDDRKQFITYLRAFSKSSVLQLKQQCRFV